MKRIMMLAAVCSVVVVCFGLIKTRSRVVDAGNTIIKLQKELWELKDTNDKLMLDYRSLATPENIIKKNEELQLGLVPPERVICVKTQDERVATVQQEGATEP